MNLNYAKEDAPHSKSYEQINPQIRIFTFDEEGVSGKDFFDHEIVYVNKGNVCFSFDFYKSDDLEAGRMIFLSTGSPVSYTAGRDTECILFSLKGEIKPCNDYYPEIRKKTTGRLRLSAKVDDKIHDLKAHPIIRKFAEDLIFFIQQGLRCQNYYELKTKELVFLLHSFYPKENLAPFWGTGLCSGSSFSSEVMKNYHALCHVEELAAKMNYTISGFEKRFKRIFGVPPSKWLREQKARLIYTDVCESKQNFKEIADKFDFASPTTFNDFYKLMFGETPGQTRKKIINGESPVKK